MLVSELEKSGVKTAPETDAHDQLGTAPEVRVTP